VTIFWFLIDPQTARRAWVQGPLFPGVISLLIILYTCFPALLTVYVDGGMRQLGAASSRLFVHIPILFVYLWLAGSMLCAWAAKMLERHAHLRLLSPVLVYISGYGPLLCAITLAARSGDSATGSATLRRRRAEPAAGANRTAGRTRPPPGGGTASPNSGAARRSPRRP
jgi:hypothetical protein